MTKFRVHSSISTLAGIALGLFIASNICLSTAWSSECEAQCTGKSGSDKAICIDMCYHPDRVSTDRMGGCGFVSGGPAGRTQNGGSLQLETRGGLSAKQTLKVTQIVNACLIVTKIDRIPTALYIAEAQIRPSCQNYIRYNEHGSVALGALNLGNEVLQMRITTRDGRDGDENVVEFAENGKLIASYGRTDDSIENGLALLKSLF